LDGTTPEKRYTYVYTNIVRGPSWSWSYGSWIYN